LGKPRVGTEFENMTYDTLRFKSAIKSKEVNAANQFSGSLDDVF